MHITVHRNPLEKLAKVTATCSLTNDTRAHPNTHTHNFLELATPPGLHVLSCLHTLTYPAVSARGGELPTVRKVKATLKEV